MKGAEIIRSIETEEINRVKVELSKVLPEIYVGDTVRVGVRIKEGNKERVQPYEGTVIAMRNGGINETITVPSRVSGRRRGTGVFDSLAPHRYYPSDAPRESPQSKTLLPARSGGQSYSRQTAVRSLPVGMHPASPWFMVHGKLRNFKKKFPI